MGHFSTESKLPSIGTSIFTVMSALAREKGAINLSQGFPDFEPDYRLPQLVTKHMGAGGNQYAPSSGLPLLRERIAALVEQSYSAKYDPETEITVTSGATEALFCAITALVKEGDEVILFEPAYDSYAPAIQLSGGIPVHIPLDFPNYAVNWENVKKRVNQRTRLIILNSPHNPTGALLSAQDMDNLTRIVEANDILILSDEVYEHIIFDGLEHQSAARYPKLASRSFIVSSFGKSFHTTGWKVGYALGPKDMMAEFRKVHQFITFSTSTPFQLAIAEFMEDLDYFKQLGAFYQEKRDLFLKLTKGSRFKPLTSQGTYFQLMSYKGISDLSDTEFANQLTIENKIASIPVSVFYRRPEQNKVLRFCFAKSNETLERAAEILQKV